MTVDRDQLLRGAPKHIHRGEIGNVPDHPAMTDQQKKMAGVGGMGHNTSIAGVLGANPVAAPAPGKTLQHDAPITAGHRSRTSPNLDSATHQALGRIIMDGAIRSTGGSDHPTNMARSIARKAGKS